MVNTTLNRKTVGVASASDKQADLVSKVRTVIGAGELRAVRIRANLSLSDIGQVIGVEPSTVLRWERGASPHWSNAVRLGTLLTLLADGQ